MRPSIVIVIPVYGAHTFSYAVDCVESALRTTPNVRVVVVDDATPEFDPQLFSHFPKSKVHVHQFEFNDGVPRSWNYGLLKAQEWGAKYTVCCNSDVLFSKRWAEGLTYALRTRWDVVGPVSNAPGRTCPRRQSVTAYMPHYELSDSPEKIDSVADYLYRTVSRNYAVESRVNGFCFMAKTRTFFNTAWQPDKVFSEEEPYKQDGHEDEWQFRRVIPAKRRIAIIPRSFVFHYRSVTRGETPDGARHRVGMWYRKQPGQTQDAECSAESIDWEPSVANQTDSAEDCA